MESLIFLRPAPFLSLQTPTSSSPKPSTSHPILFPSRPFSLPSALKNPRGFGPSSRTKKPKQKRTNPNGDDDDEKYGDDAEEDGTIPEVVTNRMIRRMGLSVGIPLVVGLLFFPFFYYLKVVAKIDIPTWIPYIVSFFFFGSALLGVSYGIVSASWDPLREGSLLGWNEALRNWPVFWQSLRGGGKK